MTTNDLGRIEKELNVVLPRFYREFMQGGKFGEGYGGTQDLNGVADEIIEANKDLRQRGFFGVEWLENYFVIGDDGAGDYYFIDAKSGEDEILFADHEVTTNKDILAVSRNKEYRTLAEFWEFLNKVNEVQERWEKKHWWRVLTRPMKFR